ncbi:MAG TPA: TetR/AcrR family transcriptional regulator [Terriglobales bacterium]|nr:TetR/AcrR family transcriptional regulator [Terriglobales bacterium]
MVKRNSPARPGAKPAPGRSSEKYQRILEAAVQVIAQNGYYNSRVSDIADRAGVADGTIYLYFQNKEQILMAAIDSAFETFLRLAREDLAKIHDPREKLRRMAFLHLDLLGKKRDLAAVFQTELRQSAKFLAQFSRNHLVEYFDLIREVVREGQQAGVFRRQLSDKIAANCFFGALDEMVTSWLLSDRDYPLGGAAEAVVDVILSGMEARPSA